MNSTLDRSNPYLLSLEDEYSKLNYFDHSNWQSYQNSVDIQNFRSDQGYLSQLNYGHSEPRYVRQFEYLSNLGLRGQIAQLGEDSAFGCVTFQTGGITYSRDLLDSVQEAKFLRDTFALSDDSTFALMDVGSGYGRLTHRLSQMFPNAQLMGTDAIPISTFLHDFYTNYRGCGSRVRTVPLHMLEPLTRGWQIDFCTNCYAFAEMTYNAIEFWIAWAAEHQVRGFVVVPHDYGHTSGAFVSIERDGTNRDYLPLFDKYGYKQIRRVYKYEPPESSPQYAWGTEYLAMELN